MSGLKVLESVLGSLDEAKVHRVRTFREILPSSHGSRVRNIIYAGTVMGVQEFDYPRVESLVGEEIEADMNDPIYGDSDTSFHLYKVMKVLQKMDSCGRPVVYKDASCLRGGKSGVFEVAPSFDSVCRDYDVRFGEKLKPSVKYSIVTPAVKIEFPVCEGWRGSDMCSPRDTDGTAIISAPFSITPNSELTKVLEVFGSERATRDFLYNAENVFEQANRVVRAVRDSTDFAGLVDGYVQLNAKVEELVKEEHLAGIK